MPSSVRTPQDERRERGGIEKVMLASVRAHFPAVSCMGDALSQNATARTVMFGFGVRARKEQHQKARCAP